MSLAVSAPWTGPRMVTGNAAAHAEIAYIEALKNVRASGRREMTYVNPMLSAARGTAYRHPNRIADVTMKTDAIETSDLPFSSIGTGLRSATSASPKKSRTIRVVDREGGSSTIEVSETPTIGNATTAVVAMYPKRR